MSECCDSIVNIILPLTIVNFVGTAAVILVYKCIKRCWASTSVLDSSKVTIINDDNSFSSDPNDSEITDFDLISKVRSCSQYQTSSDHVLSTRDELSKEQGSLESMAGTLISVTKNIAGALDNANHIPKEKKEELASLLKGVPGFISKIVDMDDDQLNSLLAGNIPNIRPELSTFTNKITTQRTLAEDHKKESDYLMKTLDSLRQ